MPPSSARSLIVDSLPELALGSLLALSHPGPQLQGPHRLRRGLQADLATPCHTSEF